MTHGVRNVIEVGALLKSLLTHNRRYVGRWTRVAGPVREQPSQAAVARVIAAHLVDRGERSERETDLARSLKDRVHKALTGEACSLETLRWFTEAFALNEADSKLLWDTFHGLRSEGIAHTIRNRREMVRPQRHRTLTLFERYSVDADGHLVTRHTMHTLRAVENGVDVYVFNHEPQAERIAVAHGGVVGQRHRYGGGLSSSEIVLNRPLAKLEATALEYRTYFMPGQVRPSEVRRAAFARAENVDIAVEFAGPVPRAAWWCVWDDHLAGGPTWEVPIDVKGGVLHQYVPYVEDAVVGFRWVW